MTSTIWKKLITVSLAGIVNSHVLLWAITPFRGYSAYGSYGYNMGVYNIPMNTSMQMKMNGGMKMQGGMGMMDMMKGMGMH